MEKKEETYAEKRQRCIQAVTEVMGRIATRTYVGGEDSEDGLYVSGADESGEWKYFTHFDPSDVELIALAIADGTLEDYLKYSK